MDCTLGCKLNYQTPNLYLAGVFSISGTEYLGFQSYDPTTGIPASSAIKFYTGSTFVLRTPLMEYASGITRMMIGATSASSVYFLKTNSVGSFPNIESIL